MCVMCMHVGRGQKTAFKEPLSSLHLYVSSRFGTQSLRHAQQALHLPSHLAIPSICALRHYLSLSLKATDLAV